MDDYGTHPTRYGNLTNDDLYSMYRSSVYSRLDEAEKLELLQETVNRDALELGETGAPRVEFASLPANESGNAANGVIHINYDMAVNGRQTIVYQGQMIEHAMDDYNIQVLNTVLHENAHCFQEQVIDRTITISDGRLTAEYQANSFTASAVLQDGSYKMGSQYLTGETPAGYSLYYFQATERDAYRSAEQKTDRIIQGLTERFGPEPSFEAYAQDIEVNGYQAMEQRARELFNSPNFEYNVNQTLQNQYFGTSIPVDPNIENAVKGEMTASYEALQKHNTIDITEEKKMGFDPKPVSLEEYNQSLRETVNACYTHAKNDPTMDREDAVRSAGETAEKYLDAVDDFKAAQEAAANDVTEGVNDAASLEAEDGVDSGDGLDGEGEGCDGGMEL